MSNTSRIRVPSRLLIPLFLLIALTTGCQTTVGNYLGNRGRDFGECFRAQVGAGPGIGASVRAGGLLDMGLLFARGSRNAGAGWVYGEGFAFGHGTRDHSMDTADESDEEREGDERHRETKFVRELEYCIGVFHYYYEGELAPPNKWAVPNSHGCFGVLPALVSRAGSRWLWSNGDERRRHARIHAFDFEATVYAGIVYARAGFSPGEFVDFLLGWVGVDIAGDDLSLERQEGPS